MTTDQANMLRVAAVYIGFALAVMGALRWVDYVVDRNEAVRKAGERTTPPGGAPIPR